MSTMIRLVVGAAVAGSLSLSAWGADWAMWGGANHRNMVSQEKNPPTKWDVESGENIKWKAAVGSQSYAGPVVYKGLVAVGTNNEGKRDPNFDADAGVLMIFSESDGKFLYQ